MLMITSKINSQDGREHSTTTFAIRTRRGSIKMQTYANRRDGGFVSMQTLHIIFFIELLFNKLLRITTRFSVSFTRIPVLLISLLKKIHFAANFQAKNNIAKDSFLYNFIMLTSFVVYKIVGIKRNSHWKCSH